MKSVHPIRWLAAGVVFMIISVPFILEMIPPNTLSGFRTSKTLSDEGIWYAANRVMGYDLLIAGALIVVAAIVTAKVFRRDPRRATRINFLVFIASLVAALLHGFWALGRM
ncbi:MAG: SdpI family protein [Acidobacteria bacterium]|nr:SdpI family protein [Acidobacteriota bacterium]